MYVTNTADLNTTNDYDNNTNCRDDGNNIDKNIATLILTIPYGPLFLCLMILMVYTSIKTLFKNN